MPKDAIRQRILRGDTVYMGFTADGRVWWFDDPYEPISDSVMQITMTGDNGGPLLVEAGDSLFGWPENSQTWRSAYG